MSKGWAYNASEGMADGLSADACWVVFPMEEGAVVAGLFFCFGFFVGESSLAASSSKMRVSVSGPYPLLRRRRWVKKADVCEA